MLKKQKTFVMLPAYSVSDLSWLYRKNNQHLDLLQTLLCSLFVHLLERKKQTKKKKNVVQVISL